MLISSFWGFWENINQSFIYYALIAGLMIAVAAPLLGSVIIVRRMSFVADTISHFSLAGAAFGAFLGGILSTSKIFDKVPTVILTISFSLIGTVLVEFVRNLYKNYKELSMPIVLSLGTALAAVFFSKVRGASGNIVRNFMFGSVFQLEKMDVIYLAISFVLLIVFFIIFRKEVITISFDEEFAKFSNKKYWTFQIIFTVLLSIFISVSMKAVGILLISSLVIIPVSSSIFIGKSFKDTIIKSIVISILSLLLGFTLSYPLNVTGGPVIVLVNILFYIIIAIYKKIFLLRKNKN